MEKFNFWSKKPGGITGTEIWPIQGATGTSGEDWNLDSDDMATFIKKKIGITTIGTGGDYLPVGAAVAAGKYGEFKFLSNVTETGSTSKVAGSEQPFTILPTNFVWNLSSYTFQYRGVKNIYCAVTNPNFNYNNIDSNTNIYNSTVTLSTTGGKWINFQNCIITVPNASVTYDTTNIRDSRIVGTNTASVLSFNGGKCINNHFSGTWATYFLSMVAGTYYPSEFTQNYGGITGNFSMIGGDTYWLSDNQLENVTFINGDISTTRNIFIDNCHFAAYSASGGAANYYTISNSRFKTLATIPNHYSSFSNCTFDASVIVPGFTTTFKFALCRFIINLTINSGATNAKFYGSTVSGTYTDNGTGTVNL